MKEKTVENNVLHLLFEGCGKPFSLKQIKIALEKKGMKTDMRSIETAVKSLERRRKIKITNLAKAIAVYLPWDFPLIEELSSLDELVRKGQYPLYAIITKMKDIGLPEEEISTEIGSGNIRKKSMESIASAKEQIMWWGGDFSVIEEFKPSIIKALEKDGLKFRILMRIDLFSLDNACKVLELQKKYPNLEVRHWESNWRGTIFDEKTVRLIGKTPRRPDAQLLVGTGKPGTDIDFCYQAFHIDGAKTNLKQWVNWLCMVWESHWKTAEINPKPMTLVRTLSEIRDKQIPRPNS